MSAADEMTLGELLDETPRAALRVALSRMDHTRRMLGYSAGMLAHYAEQCRHWRGELERAIDLAEVAARLIAKDDTTFRTLWAGFESKARKQGEAVAKTGDTCRP
jgi:hypothetical protein